MVNEIVLVLVIVARIPDDVGSTAAEVAVPLSSVIVTAVGAERSNTVNEQSFDSAVCGMFGEVSFCRAAADVCQMKDGVPPMLAVYHGDTSAPRPGNGCTLNAAPATVGGTLATRNAAST